MYTYSMNTQSYYMHTCMQWCPWIRACKLSRAARRKQLKTYTC